MSTPAFLVAFTISDTRPDGIVAVAFFILLIHFMTMPLSIKRGTMLTVSA